VGPQLLLHLDLDQFRDSRLGKFLIKDVIVKKVDGIFFAPLESTGEKAGEAA